MQQPNYAYDPTMARVPLDPDEVAELLVQRPRDFTRDDKQVWLLVERAHATAAALRHQSQQFDLEMQSRSAAMPHSGIPGNISPEQAARFLSPQQLRRLFDTFSKERLDALDRQIARAEQSRVRIEEILSQLEAILVDRDGEHVAETLRTLDDLRSAITTTASVAP